MEKKKGGSRQNGGASPLSAAERERRERKMFMSSKVSKIREAPTEKPTSRKRKRAELTADEEIEQELKELSREVHDFGASQFTGRRKKQWDEQKIISLGGHASKKPKMPYHMLIGKKKKEAEREEKRIKKLKETGMYVAGVSNKANNNSNTADSSKKKVGLAGIMSGERGLKASAGFYRNGVLYVKPPPDIRKREEAENKEKKGRPKWRKKNKGKKGKKGRK
ncbi:Coiled-coil domain-containing protein 137 [Balamuthia mandrillaris]